MNNRKLTPGGATAAAAPVPWYLAGGVSAANCVGAYQAIGAASQAASYTNLANPGTYTLTTAAAPTWDVATGWKGDGTSQYLQTGIAIVTNAYSAIVRFSGGSVRNQSLLHAYSAVTQQFAITQTNGPGLRFYNGSTLLAIAGQVNSGVLCIAGGDVYRDGTDIGNVTVGTAAGGATALLAMFNSDNSVYSAFAGIYMQAAAIYSVTLTPAQVAAITTEMAALTDATPPF